MLKKLRGLLLCGSVLGHFSPCFAMSCRTVAAAFESPITVVREASVQQEYIKALEDFRTDSSLNNLLHLESVAERALVANGVSVIPLENVAKNVNGEPLVAFIIAMPERFGASMFNSLAVMHYRQSKGLLIFVPGFINRFEGNVGTDFDYSVMDKYFKAKGYKYYVISPEELTHQSPSIAMMQDLEQHFAKPTSRGAAKNPNRVLLSLPTKWKDSEGYTEVNSEVTRVLKLEKVQVTTVDNFAQCVDIKGKTAWNRLADQLWLSHIRPTRIKTDPIATGGIQYIKLVFHPASNIPEGQRDVDLGLVAKTIMEKDPEIARVVFVPNRALADSESLKGFKEHLRTVLSSTKAKYDEFKMEAAINALAVFR